MSGKFAVLGEMDKPAAPAAPASKPQQQKKAPAAPAAADANAAAAAPAPKVGGAAASTQPHGPRGAEKNRGNRPPRREFDRQSGTGRGREVRKNGEGKGGWGNERNPNPRNKDVEAKNVEGGEKPEGAAPEADKKADGEAAAPQPQEKKAPEEPPIFTLEDFERQKKAASVEGDNKPARAIESTDNKSVKTINKGTVNAPKVVKSKAKEKTAFSLDEFVGSTPAPAQQNSGFRRFNSTPKNVDLSDAKAFPKLK